MEYNLYRISSGTLVAIAATTVLGVVLALVLHRKAAVPAGRSVWIALAVASAAAVALITLTPSGRGGTYACSFETDGGVFGWVRGNQSTANVAMLVPVAVALPLTTRSTRWHRWSFVALVAFPVLIEAAQATVPLGRACDGMDVVDNWFGVAFGCLLGGAGKVIAASVQARGAGSGDR